LGETGGVVKSNKGKHIDYYRYKIGMSHKIKMNFDTASYY